MKPVEVVEYNPYYSSYVEKVTESSVTEGLKNSFETSLAFYKSIPDDKWEYRYAEGKWTIKEILQHLIDAERVFAYRAMCIARGETNGLPGYDHDAYLNNSNANSRSHENLMQEYTAVRQATLILFETFNDDTLLFKGTANGSPISVRALGFIIAGHEKHHNSVISERYI